MKTFCFVFALVITSAQAQSETGKLLEVHSKTGKTLQFDNISINSKTGMYKSLLIKYTNKKTDKNLLFIDGHEHRLFNSKKEAVAHYYTIKDSAPKKSVYYVYSLEKKIPEVLSIRTKIS